MRVISFKTKDLGDYAIDVHSTYRWKPTGLIVFVTDFDLETFSGIVIFQGTEKDKKFKLGKKSRQFNADGVNWEEIIFE